VFIHEYGKTPARMSLLQSVFYHWELDYVSLFIASLPIRVAELLFCFSLITGTCQGQGLTPRAYVITPTHSNAGTLTYNLQQVEVFFSHSGGSFRR
jgi:hypothetical protein